MGSIDGKYNTTKEKAQQPVDILSKIATIPNSFAGTTPSTQQQDNFSAKDYSNLTDPAHFKETTGLEGSNAAKQPASTMVANTVKQFGANLVSSVGQGLANTFDMSAMYKTIKGEVTDGKDDFNSSLFGLTAKDMQSWANEVAKNNPILEKRDGAFDLSDPGWWAKQIASSGTGVGMAVEALGTTAVIEAATGGLGTAGAMAKLGSMFSKIRRGEQAATILADGFSAAKGMRSAATLYGTLSRVSESRMEAMNNYTEIYDDLSQQTNKDGTPKYSEDEKQKYASQGARRDFNINLALLPLDILSYRTMVFNPISGSAEGLLEKGLSKIAGLYGKSKIGRGAGWLTTHAIGSQFEGIEEGFQNVGENEGSHYARVLGGLDDGSTFAERLGKQVKSDDFWNNYAGGIIGSPIIAGAMNIKNAFTTNNRAKAVADAHKNFITNIGKMDDAYATKIKEYEDAGKVREAATARRQFSASKALAALHLDAMTDKDTAFDSRITFIDGVIEELNNNKTTALSDLGFSNMSPEQLGVIKQEFETYKEDAEVMRDTYNSVKDKYNKNFVPQIAQTHFELNRLQKEMEGVDTELAASASKVTELGLLSPQGRELHDTEYRINALNYENSRLTNLHRNTENKFEKENAAQLLKQNQAKLTSLNERVKELNEDENYDKTVKDSDADIINSALLNSNYQQAVYDKEALTNAITLKRKDAALWNKKEYLEEKTKQSLPNLRTRQQVQNVATNTTNPTIVAEANTRSSEIAAQEAAENEPEIMNTGIPPGNSDLFAEDNEALDDITNTIGIHNALHVPAAPPAGEATDNSDGVLTNDIPLFSFSPATYDFENSSEDAKLKIKNGVKGIQDRLGANSSFEELVRHVAKLKGFNAADGMFNALKYGWEENGNPKVDYEKVYAAIFGDPVDELIAGVSQLALQTIQELEQANKEVTDGVLARDEKKPDFDSNNQPVYKYNGIITNESSPKAAFVTRLSELTTETDEEGNTVVSNEYTASELNNGSDIDSLQLLDPDKYTEGSETEIRVPENFNDILIPVYNTDGTKAASMTFGQYVASKNLTPDMSEYKDKLPMIHYRRGAPKGEKGLFFVHDIGWYHPLRFNVQFADDMKQAIEATRAIRDEVIANGTQPTNAVITGKRQTTFAGLKTGGALITLREANPDTQLTLVLNGALATSKKLVAFPNSETELVNTQPFVENQIMDVRRYGLKDGIKTFLASFVIKPKINQATKDTVTQAITIYANRDNKDTTLRGKHDAAVKHIKDVMGLDILSSGGLEKYLQHFINTFNTEKATGQNAGQIAGQQAQAKLAKGTPYLAFVSGGQIVFGQAGIPVKQYMDTKIKAQLLSQGKNEAEATEGAKVVKWNYFINPSALAYIGEGLGQLNAKITVTDKTGKASVVDRLGWYEQNLNLDNLNTNKPIISIKPDGTTSQTADSYKDHLLDNLQTNLKSHNIGTKENPNYVTNIQPVITYDTVSRLAKQTEQPTMQEVASEVVTEAPQSIEAESQIKETPADIQAFLDRMKSKLGDNFGIQNDSDFSPAVLTPEQRNEVTKSIDRIAGLLPHQQAQVVDFIFNQIVPALEANNGIATQTDVDKVIKSALDTIFNPQIEGLKKEIAYATALLKQFPEMKGEGSEVEKAIRGSQLQITKIEAVTKNLDALKSLAMLKVDKYTNIKSKTVKQSSLESEKDDNDNDRDDESMESKRDFWTDILQENPENKATYKMRRFFGQIRATDKAGNQLSGFLGLPTYVESDVVIRNLMTTLADVPSNFDDMIAALDKRKEGITWMPDVIAKLKAADKQMQNSFVTVMSNTALRMKFTMISYNRKAGTWSTKVYDTNQSGVSTGIKNMWKSNLFDTSHDLISIDNEGNYTLNRVRAEHLIDIFNGWKGKNIPQVSSTNLESLREVTVGKVKTGKSNTFIAKGTLLQEFKNNIVGKGNKMAFSMINNQYQITSLGNDKYEVAILEKNTPEKADIEKWLGEFGIVISPNTLNELMRDGLYHNYHQRSYDSLFEEGANTNGLFGILKGHLEGLLTKTEFDFNENGDSPLDNSVVTSLANLEAKYNTAFTPFGFRDNGKSFFGLTAPKFITDRARDLKMIDSEVRKQLGQISFSQNSLWLRLLEDEEFRAKFQVSHIGDTAMKEQGSKRKVDNSLPTLADADHELTKLGMFWDTLQGAVSYNTTDSKGNAVTLKTFPGSNIELRMATMFSPTMSDKHMMTLITTAVLELQNADLGEGTSISDEVANIIYDQTIKPELKRMLKFVQNGSKTNIKGYKKGAEMFLLMPEMNNIEIYPGVKLIDAIKDPSGKFTLQQIESNEDFMKNVRTVAKQYVDSLAKEKLQVWKNNGYITEESKTDDKGVVTTSIKDLKFFDAKYLNKFRGSKEQQAQMAAMDFVVNSLIANANSFMAFAGDPALYYKSGKQTALEQAQDTFTNVGKRLANQIAPGTTLSNSEKEQYLQIFLNDRKSTAGNIDYLKELLGEEGASAYSEIEGSDAQEYTTWKEWLDILTKLGKSPDGQADITPEEIQTAREMFASGKNKSDLTSKEKDILNKVAQPLKPVYTGQIYDKANDVMRTVYIKSSSFPLIPQLTAGLEIDKLRSKMEQMQTDRQLNVRASYQSGNKVGAMSNAVDIWNDDGTANDAALNQMAINNEEFSPTLVLDRKNFRIQQEVPFKSGKQGEDHITLGTQLMKLLFGDGVMNMTGFTYEGKSLTGKELHGIYNDTFIKLIDEKRDQLFTELGLDQQGNPIDSAKTALKLQDLLRDEAIKRDYPLQDIQGLGLSQVKNSTGKVIGTEFNLPLWASSNSNRYESMLNSIITNRLIKMKFPGNSFVVGSPEGFVKQDNLNGVDQSKIIYTSAWNGKELVGTTHADGRVKKAQVLVASKFKDNQGNLIDLFTQENGKYKYITKTDTGYTLNQDMFDEELLSLMSFRIPTSGHQSASLIEIAGFLPHMNGDLMIVPSNFTKQKGLDFDVDKENSYQLNQIMTNDGKFEVLSEKHRTQVLAAADKLKENPKDSAANSLFDSIFGDAAYSIDEIKDDKFLAKANSAFNEKLLQNSIVKIHHSIFSNPSNEMQGKIAKVLSTSYAEQQADFIDGINNSNKDNKFWTPLSDEYQKQKLMSGASGKIGTGAYSIDVVFHSLAQQAAINGRPITLNSIVETEEGSTVSAIDWRFGKYETNGVLGRSMTLDGSRSISDVQAERQNIAVDNEKLQVMGRVGLNELTMDVDKVFNMLGFDKDENGNSISFLFLSQPIIKDYVDMMRNASSNMATFNANKEATIKQALTEKYNFDNNILDKRSISDFMNGNSLLANLFVPHGQLQVAILDRFLEMKKYGEALRSVQTSINTDSKGLGKSFFDVIEKREALNRLGTPTTFKDTEGNPIGNITGASGLIGTYETKQGVSPERYKELVNKGYIDIGQYLVLPDTLSGAFSVKGVTTAYNLWSKYFPYDAAISNEVMKEVLSVIGGDNIGATKAVELKQDIFRGMKKYFPTSVYSGFIDSTDKINAERASLFIDTADNVSLATYIKTIKQQSTPAIDQFIKTNKLLNRFEFNIQKNGQPSLIRFNNAAGEEFDEQYLYEGLSTLMEVRGNTGSVQLPQVGNKQYTLDSLAQALIEYTYIANATQEAIQFTKYVPLSYLEQIGYAEKMRLVNRSLETNPAMLGLKIGKADNEKHLVSEFTMQYVQHNPEKVKYNFDEKNIQDVNGEGGKFTNLNDVNTFKLNNGDNPIFIKAYNSSIPKGEKKQNLFWFDGTQYVKIPVLGAFGMDEYQRGVDPDGVGTGTSIVNGVVKAKPNPTTAINGKSSVSTDVDALNINSGSAATVLSAIASANIEGFSDLATALLPFIGNIPISYADTVDDRTNFEGLHQIDAQNNSVIYISPTIVSPTDTYKTARVVLHEVVHALTKKQVFPYVTHSSNGDVSVKSNAPGYITDLVRLYNNVREMANKDDLTKILERVNSNQSISTQDKNEKYGLTNIFEFMSMALTQPEFQQYLAKTEFKQSGRTLLDQFKEIINKVLSAIGVKFDSDTAAAQAINSIFEIIQKENAPNTDVDIPNDVLEQMYREQEGLDNLTDGDSLGSLSANEFPDKELTIKDEKCN